MTELLQQAFDQAAKLPPDEQDTLARKLLVELADPKEWEREFEKTQELLANRAEDALLENLASHPSKIIPGDKKDKKKED